MADQDPDEQKNRAVDIAQGKVAPNTLIGEPLPGQPAPGVYLGASGENLGTTQGTAPPPGTTGVQGQLSPEEKTFWAANPFGAVKDPQTGALVGLGGTGPEAQRIAAQYPQTPVPTYTGVGAPQPPGPPPDTGQRQPMSVQDFYSPILQGRINDFDQAIAESSDRMRSANTQAPRHGISDYQKEVANFSQLQRGRQALAGQLRDSSQLAFKTQLENTKMETDTRHANTGSNILGWISSLPTNDPATRYQAWSQALANNPEWLDAIKHNPELNAHIQKTLEGHQSVAEQHAALQANLPQGQTAEISGGSLKSPTFKVKPSLAEQQQEAITKAGQQQIGKDFTKAGTSPDEFAQRTKVERGNISKLTGKFTNADDGDKVRVTVPGGTFHTDWTAYTRMNQAYPQAKANAENPAEAYLRANNLPVTDANIQHYLKNAAQPK